MQLDTMEVSAQRTVHKTLRKDPEQVLHARRARLLVGTASHPKETRRPRPSHINLMITCIGIVYCVVIASFLHARAARPPDPPRAPQAAAERTLLPARESRLARDAGARHRFRQSSHQSAAAHRPMATMRPAQAVIETSLIENPLRTHREPTLTPL